MRKHSQKDRLPGLPALLLAAFVVAFTPCSCVNEEMSDCDIFPLLRVTLSIEVDAQAVDVLGDTIPGNNVMLHSFDATGLLLDTRVTANGKLERLPAATARAVAIAGIPVAGARETSSPLVKGISRLSDGHLRLLPATPATWNGLDLYAFPDDLFWGAIDIPAPAPGVTREIFDLPVSRVVAGIHARLTNARAFLAGVTGLSPAEIVASDIDMVIGTSCNNLDFNGNISFTRAASDPVNYRATGEFAATGDRLDLPATTTAATALPRLLVLGAPSPGLPFSVSLYHRGIEVPGSPFPVRGTDRLVNGKMNIIDVLFPSGLSGVTVTVTSIGWEDAPPTVKPFD
jgi:hypothetical protein